MSKGLVKCYKAKYVSNTAEIHTFCNPKVKMHDIMLFIMWNFNNINKYNLENWHLGKKN